MKKETVSVLEITESYVKYFQSKLVRGVPELVYSKVRDLDSPTDENIIQAVASIIDSKNAANKITVIIPRQFAILKQVNFPSQDAAELKNMIAVQLSTQIPYAVDEVVYDFHVLSEDSTGYSKVLITIVHKDIIDRYFNLLKSARIFPYKLLISSYGLLSWLTYQEDQQNITTSKTTLLVNVDHKNTELCFCSDRKLLFSRVINYGMDDLHNQNIFDLTSQVEISLEAFRKIDAGPPVENILLLTTFSDIRSIKTNFEDKFKIRTEIQSPLNGMAIPKVIQGALLKQQEVLSLTAGLGALMSGAEGLVNLIPSEIDFSTKSYDQKKDLVKLFGLLLLVGLIAGAISGTYLFKKSKKLEQIKLNMKEMEVRVEEAKKKINYVREFKEEFSSRVIVADFFSSLYPLIPSEIIIKNISLNKQNVISVTGYAESSSSVNVFQKSLLNSSSFEDVRLKFATQRKGRNAELTDFQIDLSILHSETSKND